MSKKTDQKLSHGQKMRLYRSAGNIVLVDFDGTLCEFKYPRFGPPIPGARDFLYALRERALDIVVWSSRLSPQYSTWAERKQMKKEIENWLRRNAMPFDEVDVGDLGKRLALAYVDDRGAAAGMDVPWENVLKRIDQIHDRELRRWENR
jgi:FMN phosphatase YigB (HAD superfamily)